MKRAFITVVVSVVAVSVFSVGGVQAHPAWGIVIDRRGQIYFSDLEAVWKIDAQGKLSLFRAGTGDRHTHELDTDEAGNLYGVDNSYEPATERFFSAVWKMTDAGGFSYLLAPTDDPPEGTSLRRDRDGNTYHVTNHPGRELLVLKRTPSGTVTALVGSRDAARGYKQGVPYSAGGTAFGADGALYFTNGANVGRVTMGGALTMLARDIAVENATGAPAGATRLTNLFGIAVGARGDVFVADHGNRRVLKISPDNRITTVVSAEQPWSPTGVAVRNDDMYILESRHTHASTAARVRKLSPGGSATVLATVGGNAEPSPAENPTGGVVERKAEPEQSAPYVLFAVGAGVAALVVFGWRARRRSG